MRPLETSRRRKRPPVRSMSIAANFGRDTPGVLLTTPGAGERAGAGQCCGGYCA